MTTDLNTVEIGGVRVGGLLGHGLHSMNQIIRSRKLWKFVGWVFLAGVFGLSATASWLGVNRWLDARHARAMQSPIEKQTYIVEDTHGAGQYMVVRHDTKHLKLECQGGKELDKDKDGNDEWNSFTQCYEFKVGDKIQLEKWDYGEFHTLVYVYKMRLAVGEYDYVNKDKDE